MDSLNSKRPRETWLNVTRDSLLAFTDLSSDHVFGNRHSNKLPYSWESLQNKESGNSLSQEKSVTSRTLSVARIVATESTSEFMWPCALNRNKTGMVHYI